MWLKLYKIGLKKPFYSSANLQIEKSNDKIPHGKIHVRVVNRNTILRDFLEHGVLIYENGTYFTFTY